MLSIKIFFNRKPLFKSNLLGVPPKAERAVEFKSRVLRCYEYFFRVIVDKFCIIEVWGKYMTKDCKIPIPFRIKIWWKIRPIFVKLGILKPIKWTWYEKPWKAHENPKAVDVVKNL